MRRQIVLTNIPTGTARVVFSEADLGNFLVHPLVVEAAKTAVQVGLPRQTRAATFAEAQAGGTQGRSRGGRRPAARILASPRLCCGRVGCTHVKPTPRLQGVPFVFDRESVRIQAPSKERPEGCIFLTGTWRRDNVRYQVRRMAGGVRAAALRLVVGSRALLRRALRGRQRVSCAPACPTFHRNRHDLRAAGRAPACGARRGSGPRRAGARDCPGHRRPLE